MEVRASRHEHLQQSVRFCVVVVIVHAHCRPGALRRMFIVCVGFVFLTLRRCAAVEKSPQDVIVRHPLRMGISRIFFFLLLPPLFLAVRLSLLVCLLVETLQFLVEEFFRTVQTDSHLHQFVFGDSMFNIPAEAKAIDGKRSCQSVCQCSMTMAG